MSSFRGSTSNRVQLPSSMFTHKTLDNSLTQYVQKQIIHELRISTCTVIMANNFGRLEVNWIFVHVWNSILCFAFCIKYAVWGYMILSGFFIWWRLYLDIGCVELPQLVHISSGCPDIHVSFAWQSTIYII